MRISRVVRPCTGRPARNVNSQSNRTNAIHTGRENATTPFFTDYFVFSGQDNSRWH